MSGRIPDHLLVHSAVVERYQGTSGSGAAVFGPPEEWPALFSGKRRLARPNGGREVTSPASVFLAPEATGIPPESRVTVGGRTAQVIEVREHIYPDLPTPDHVQLLCD